MARSLRCRWSRSSTASGGRSAATRCASCDIAIIHVMSAASGGRSTATRYASCDITIVCDVSSEWWALGSDEVRHVTSPSSLCDVSSEWLALGRDEIRHMMPWNRMQYNVARRVMWWATQCDASKRKVVRRRASAPVMTRRAHCIAAQVQVQCGAVRWRLVPTR